MSAAAGPEIIYILGVGRSGSTLLERMLASAPHATGVGEVHVLWRRPLRDLVCACGAPAPECGFWAEARARAGLGAPEIAELRDLEWRAVRHRRIAARGFSLPALSADPDIARFNALQTALFGAVAEMTGATFIIDSSKAAPRAWALAAARPDMKIIRLTRRARDVARSWASMKTDPFDGPMRRSAVAQARERVVTAASAAILAAQRPVTPLRYAALAADPRAALTAALGRQATEGVAWRGARVFAPDPLWHALSGNPDRFGRGPVEVRPPAECKEAFA